MPSNPFFEHALLTDPTMFYGRENEIMDLCEWLSKKQCISIVGQRRIGKSTLLYHLCTERTYSKYLTDSENFIFVYLDLREISGAGSSGFFQAASKGILRSAGSKLPPTQKIVHTSQGFRDLIEVIVSQGLIPILCLDEFEGLVASVDSDINGEFFGFLRSLGNDHRLLMVTSSREPLYKICQTGDIAVSQFWNIFITKSIGLISSGNARRLIVEPTERNGQEFTDEDVEFVLHNAGAYPFFIQRACYQLFQHYETRQLSRLDYESIRNSLYEESLPYLEDIWRNLSEDERFFLKGKGASLKEATRGRVKDGLKTKGLLDDRYLMFSSIFEEFIREKQLEKVAEKQSFATQHIRTSGQEPIEQVFSLQFGPDDVLGLELRGLRDFREHIKVSMWSEREIEEIRSRARDLVEARNWRTSINSIGREIFAKFSKYMKVISVFNNAFPNNSDRTRVIFRIPREMITFPLEWIMTSDVPISSLTDQIPLGVQCSVSKYITGVFRKQHPLPTNFVSDSSVRMLFISSNAAGSISMPGKKITLPAINQVDTELNIIEELFRKGQSDGRIKCSARFIHSRECSVSEIIREMSSNYDWIHYAGHAWHDENNPENSSVFFLNETGNAENITSIAASQINDMARASGVRGVYLSSCTGADAAPGISLAYGDFLGIMDALVVANVPSVIAMRWPLPDKSALLLASEFYRMLFLGMPIDYALYAAKRTVYTQLPSDSTWASPILIHQVP